MNEIAWSIQEGDRALLNKPGSMQCHARNSAGWDGDLLNVA